MLTAADGSYKNPCDCVFFCKLSACFTAVPETRSWDWDALVLGTVQQWRGKAFLHWNTAWNQRTVCGWKCQWIFWPRPNGFASVASLFRVSLYHIVNLISDIQAPGRDEVCYLLCGREHELHFRWKGYSREMTPPIYSSLQNKQIHIATLNLKSEASQITQIPRYRRSSQVLGPCTYCAYICKHAQFFWVFSLELEFCLEKNYQCLHISYIHYSYLPILLLQLMG